MSTTSGAIALPEIPEDLGVTFEDGPFPAEYFYTRARWGVWRRAYHESGHTFAEFKTYASASGLPFIHITWGVCPSFRTRITARGWLAIGRFALGFFAVGQVSAGLFALGQATFGIAVALGQACAGFFAIGQAALGVIFGIGQLATGIAAVGQFAAGEYVLAQFGLGPHVWDMRGRDLIAEQFFTNLMKSLQ